MNAQWDNLKHHISLTYFKKAYNRLRIRKYKVNRFIKDYLLI